VKMGDGATTLETYRDRDGQNERGESSEKLSFVLSGKGENTIEGENFRGGSFFKKRDRGKRFLKKKKKKLRRRKREKEAEGPVDNGKGESFRKRCRWGGGTKEKPSSIMPREGK